MATEMGEYVVGAYLKLEAGCDFVDYNVRTPGGGVAGLNELDVIGLNFRARTAYLCEVTTHIRGMLIGRGNAATLERIKAKYQRQRAYADGQLKEFPTRHFMLWSPVVPRGFLTEHLAKIEGLDLVINGEYKRRIDQLRARAAKEAQETGNPFFRALQILEHMRE